MTLQVSITFETVTEESARDGDAADRGFVVEREQWSVRDTIARLSQCSELSDSDAGPYTWASDEPSQDYRTGEYYSESVHIARADGSPLSGHQALRLFRAAGLIRTRTSLLHEANRSASWRGHQLDWSVTGPETAIGVCGRCGYEALVNNRPQPNGITIGGPAVALGCSRAE